MEKVSVLSVLDITTMKSLLHDPALAISPDTKYSRHTKCLYCLSVQNWLCCVTSVSQVAGQTGLLRPRCYYHQSFCMILLKVKLHFTSSLGVCPSLISLLQFSKQTYEVKLSKRQLPIHCTFLDHLTSLLLYFKVIHNKI